MSAENGTIWIVPVYLQTLENQVRRMVADLSMANERFPDSPAADAGYLTLSKRWDEKRDKLQTNLDGVADALHSIRTLFSEADVQLAAQLEG